MALVRDPNWTGPGPGPFIDDAVVESVTPKPVISVKDDAINNDDWEEDASTRKFVGEGKNRKRRSLWRNGTQEEWREEDAPVADPEEDPPDNSGTVTSKFTFTAAQTAQINALAQKAGGYFSGDTQDYIDRLTAGLEGDAFDTAAALNILIQQGAAKGGNTNEGDGNEGDGNEGDGNEGDGNEGDGTSEEKTDAFSRLQELLSRIGLTSLTQKVKDLIARGILDGDAIMFELRGTDEYQKRFIANVARKANKLPELSPLIYVALEQKYRETLKANGLNADLYDEESDFIGLIEGDVGPGELQDRIEKGYRAVMDADPEVIRQMQELYNVSVADIAHFFLDPKKTAPELERKAQAAKVAARAKEQGKMQLTSITAEELVTRGYTESQAQQAFSMLSESAGLYDEMAGEDALTQGQKIGSAFGYDTTSKQAIQKRAAVRKAAISSSSKFTSTTGATSGTTETGLNVAQ